MSNSVRRLCALVFLMISTCHAGGFTPVTWEHLDRDAILSIDGLGEDWSAANALVLNVELQGADALSLAAIVESRYDAEVYSYFVSQIELKPGSAKIVIPFGEFSKVRNPVGWDHVTAFKLSAKRNQAKADPNAVLSVSQVSVESIELAEKSGAGSSFNADLLLAELPSAPYKEPPSQEEILGHFNRKHPYLLISQERLAEIRELVKTDPFAQQAASNTLTHAEDILNSPLIKYEKTAGRLLSVSRGMLDRMETLTMAFWLTGDHKYVQRAVKEMETVAGFPDWDPSHFLDVAEMCRAMACGFDWLYDELTAEQRKIIVAAIQHMGFAPYEKVVTRALQQKGTVAWPSGNWSFVCHGGISMGAIALLGELPEESSNILKMAFRSIQDALQEFEPDGAWPEGPGYWNYSVRYLFPYIKSMEFALGTDFGLWDVAKGFQKTADFPVYLTGPAGFAYPYSDAGRRPAVTSPWLFVFADRENESLYQNFALKNLGDRGAAAELLIYKPMDVSLQLSDLPRERCFRETEVATARSRFEDNEASFVGFKCGGNESAGFHFHYDLGSFIFESLGKVWAMDLGMDHATYLHQVHGYKERSLFYRVRAEGHNTLVIGKHSEKDQNPKAFSRISRFEHSGNEVIMVSDLSEAYAGDAAHVERGLRLFDERRRLLIQDEIRDAGGSEIRWFMHTEASIKIQDETHALLKHGDKYLQARLLSPAKGASFLAMDAKPLPGSPNPPVQTKNPGVSKLTVYLPKADTVTIAVELTPFRDGEEPAPPLAQLLSIADWQVSEDYPKLTVLNIDGKPVAGFDPDIFDYPVYWPNPAQTPDLTWQSPSEQVCVLDQGTVPGIFRLEVSDSSEQSTEYRIRFYNDQPSEESDETIVETVDGIRVWASDSDGNAPANTLDRLLPTRWSALGKGQWIAFDLGEEKSLPEIELAFFRGVGRMYQFAVEISADGQQWQQILEQKSSGTTDELERYALPQNVKTRYVRIVGDGNTVNEWNSISEICLFPNEK